MLCFIFGQETKGVGNKRQTNKTSTKLKTFVNQKNTINKVKM